MLDIETQSRKAPATGRAKGLAEQRCAEPQLRRECINEATGVLPGRPALVLRLAKRLSLRWLGDEGVTASRQELEIGPGETL